MSSRPPQDPFVGRVVAERYRILGPVAKGGMGAVYRGEHIHMRKRVAIKVLHHESENLPELVARFERESVVGAHATHANVATATDFGRDADGSYYLVTEFIEGITLKELLGRGPMDVDRAVDIARQIASGLDAIHRLGIFHRDLNPRNVMVSEEPPDHVKLIDFGFAKVPIERFAGTAKQGAALTAKGVVFGTIGYVAPESAFGMHTVAAAGDLYALGVIMYEMLTGEHPFDKSDQKELYRCHQMEPPPPFHERAPERHVPPLLESVTMRLLEKSPQERHGTALDVITAIDRALAVAQERPVAEPARDEAPSSEPVASEPAPSEAPAPRSEPVSREESPQPAHIDVRSPKAKGMPGHVWLLAAAAVVLAVVAFVPGVRERVFGSRSSASVWASAAPPVASTPSVSADPMPAPAGTPSAARPAKIGELDAEGWRAELRSAVLRNDANRAADAVLAIAAIDPDRFRDAAIVADAATAANLIAQIDSAPAKRYFDLLASNDLGPAGADILYRLVTLHGGSRGATRAAELLARDDVLQNASPALRVAQAMRNAACSDRPALLDRAAREGDDRMLVMLVSMRAEGCQGCCLKQEPKLDDAIRSLRERLAQP